MGVSKVHIHISISNKILSIYFFNKIYESHE